MLLAGDIGGTKTNLAVFSPEDGLRAPLAEATFQRITGIADYPSLEALVREFLSQVDLKAALLRHRWAGPVLRHCCATGCGWSSGGWPGHSH